MQGAYVLAPVGGWVVAGISKFAINTIRSRSLAWKQIGYGGLPSTHSSIVSTTAFLVGLREGFDTPLFAVAATLALIVIMDAMSLRRRIGDHAAALNRLLKAEAVAKPLRERLGHHPLEVVAGIMTGLGCAAGLHSWF